MKTSILKIADTKNIWNTIVEENAFNILLKAPELVDKLKEAVKETNVLEMELFKESFPSYNTDLYTFEVSIFLRNSKLLLKKVECIDKEHYLMNNEIFISSKMLIQGTRVDEFSTSDNEINHPAWSALFYFDDKLAYVSKFVFNECFEALEKEYLYKENIIPRLFLKEDIVAPEE